MDDIRYDTDCLHNPQMFAMGRLPAVSDHETYATAAEADGGRSSLSMLLDGRWQFAYASTPEARPIGFAATDFDCSGWGGHRRARAYPVAGYRTPQYVNKANIRGRTRGTAAAADPHRENPVGCYVDVLHPAELWAGRRVTLTLHGVETACFVWLNGVPLGYAEDSFTPSRFDLSAALAAGSNKLAVEVYRYSSASWIEDQDFWRFSGIFRSVELRAEPRAHVEDVFVRAEPDDALESGLISADIRLRLPSEPVTLLAELLAADGRAADSVRLPAQAEMRIARRIDRPLLWSAEQPNLYTLRITLMDENGETLEVAQTETGFRRVQIRGGVLLLNGKRLRLRGVNRHEFSCKAGRALTEAEMRFDIQTLKRNNINACAHQPLPNQSLWYRLCDRYGIYLIDEANLESHGSWNEDGQGGPRVGRARRRARKAGRVRRQGPSMLERYKNHPSVLLWSCGNESYGGANIHAMAAFFRERDPAARALRGRLL
jgi:beta-galactosidase